MFLCIIKVLYYGSVVTRLIIPVQCMKVVKNLFFECTENQGEWEKVHPNLSASMLSNYYRYFIRSNAIISCKLAAVFLQTILLLSHTHMVWWS